MDYYELLEVNSTASGAEIKRAYRRLSFAYHPDKNPSPEAEERFKAINAAYDVLSDPEKRRTYDLRGVVFQFDIETPVPQTPRHRDPRYRRRSPQPHQSRSEKYSIQEVMVICMKYFTWINRVGFVITFLYALDYHLPYSMQEETVSSYKSVHSSSGRNSESHILLTTSEGTVVKVPEPNGNFLKPGQKVFIERTRIYSTMMTAHGDDNSSPMQLSIIYGGLAIFPVGVFITSSIALLFKKRLHTSFNMSIICAVFLFITLFLIF